MRRSNGGVSGSAGRCAPGDPVRRKRRKQCPADHKSGNNAALLPFRRNKSLIGRRFLGIRSRDHGCSLFILP
jgi:hypothetical protein